jgi:hypothetical protein
MPIPYGDSDLDGSTRRGIASIASRVSSNHTDADARACRVSLSSPGQVVMIDPVTARKGQRRPPTSPAQAKASSSRLAPGLRLRTLLTDPIEPPSTHVQQRRGTCGHVSLHYTYTRGVRQETGAPRARRGLTLVRTVAHHDGRCGAHCPRWAVAALAGSAAKSRRKIWPTDYSRPWLWRAECRVSSQAGLRGLVVTSNLRNLGRLADAD